MLINAQVAELVDALASGASGRKVVEVRVFSWAPFTVGICIRILIQKYPAGIINAERGR